jgi:hypothetical protein
MVSTPLVTAHTASGMVHLPAKQHSASLRLAPKFPDGGLWKGQCHRIVLRFEHADSGRPVETMQPFLGAAMHALLIANPADGFSESSMMHSHGYPEQLDDAVRARNKESADLCSMMIHTTIRSDDSGNLGSEVVMYTRFHVSGVHWALIQVCDRWLSSSSQIR